MLTQDLVLAALKKVGPCSPGALADHLQVERHTVTPHLNALLEQKKIKATGVTKGRRVALPEQEFDGAPTPPQRKHKKARNPKSGRKTRQHRKTHLAAARAEPTAERFIPAVDAHQRLVIVNGGEPLVFTDAQTTAIAELLLQHYKA